MLSTLFVRTVKENSLPAQVRVARLLARLAIKAAMATQLIQSSELAGEVVVGQAEGRVRRRKRERVEKGKGHDKRKVF